MVCFLELKWKRQKAEKGKEKKKIGEGRRKVRAARPPVHDVPTIWGLEALPSPPPPHTPSAMTFLIRSFISPISTTCPTKSFWSRLAAPKEPGPAKNSSADCKSDMAAPPGLGGRAPAGVGRAPAEPGRFRLPPPIIPLLSRSTRPLLQP